MENMRIPKTSILEISHLPSIGLLLGYLAYWAELYIFKSRNSCTSPLAIVLFILVASIIIKMQKKHLLLFFGWVKYAWSSLERVNKIYVITGFLFVLVILSIAFYAATLPPHLVQEFDSINYHISIPRQHLILGNFQHIRWSAADLFLLPLDFALAPYWLITNLPNKIPQFVFFICLVLISINLVKRFSQNNFNSICLVVFAIFGSHFIGIQIGTAMLDIVICYLFLAGLDSFMQGNIGLSAIEFCFFFWSKPFIPLQMLVLIIAMFFTYFILKSFGIKNVKWGFEEPIASLGFSEYSKKLKKMLVLFVLLSLIIAGPFIAKSIYYASTPFYPFKVGIININKNIDKDSAYWASILRNSQAHMNAKDSYGYGKSTIDFIRHLWLIAVPEEGVTNKYDYPVGLPYLIFLAPFLYLFTNSLRKKEFSIIPVFLIAYWFSWWFGSQQTRFLYIPFILMFIIVSAQISRPSYVLMFALIFSLIFTSISVFRANKADFGVARLDVLRNKDKEILRLNNGYLKQKRKDKVYLDYYDVAFACFPVEVKKEILPWSLSSCRPQTIKQ